MIFEMTQGSIPILLLKTESVPGDAYHELFSAGAGGGSYAPRFVPVMQHRFEESAMDRVRSLLLGRGIAREPGSPYGGLIFTSQRAVEAFTKVVRDNGQGDPSWPHLQDIPVYSVGPATTRAIRAIPQSPTALQIFGEHTGNGETLAPYILDHYSEWYPDREPRPPLLFLVGDQRRDIIPKTLMNEDLPANRRIAVDEEVIYGTKVMESFPADFAKVLKETEGVSERWVVVFSPTGCESMLRGLGLLEDGEDKVAVNTARRKDGKTYIATIGPTTRNYLRDTFGFEPDVCAEKPSPEGILEGIQSFRSTSKT